MNRNDLSQIYITNKTHQVLKVHAAKLGEPMNSIVERLVMVELGLDRPLKNVEARKRKGNGK